MGTRGAYGFRLNGKDKVTYNHFDSNPDGLGAEILAFAGAMNIDDTKKAVAELKLVKGNYKPTKALVAKARELGCINTDVSEQSENDIYCVLRETQGNLYKTLTIGCMIDSAEFLADSLFCEWAYIINLDDEVLEVYKGSNKDTKAPGRYAGLRASRPDGREVEYAGVELIATYPLTSLPTREALIALDPN